MSALALPPNVASGAVLLGQPKPKPKPARPTRIFGWLGDNAGCAYYRCTLPMSNLPEAPWQAGVATTIPDEYFMRFDVIVGQRVCKPGVTQRWQRICADPDVKAVYELDDDFWTLDPSNSAHDWYAQPHIRANLQANITAADLVTVSTEPLADRVRPWNPNVVVLPNYIDAQVLDLPRPDQSVDTVTIGWAGSSTHDMDWVDAGPAIAKVVTSLPNARMSFLGARYPQGMPRDKVSWTPWQESVGMYLELLTMPFDIAVAPLAAHPFNAAKSDVKAKEYAACGIPIVASNVRPYAEFVVHGETGFLVKDPSDWGRYLKRLINDRDMRIGMGENARKLAAEHTIQGHIGEYERAWSK